MLLAAIEPYLKTIKLVALAVVIAASLGLGAKVGCSVARNESADTIKTLTDEKATLSTQLAQTAAAVEAANQQVKANKQFAKEREKMAEDAAKQAEKAKKEMDAQGRAYEKKLRDAAKNPDCKAVLEQKLCPLVMDY